MSILDPYLKYLSRCSPEEWERIALESAVAVTPTTANIMLQIDDNLRKIPKAVTQLGFRQRTRAGRVFTGDMPRSAIAKLEKVEGLKRAEASRGLRNELNLAVPEARNPGSGALGKVIPDDGPKGHGVIVGIIDTGIDYTHQSFRNSDGSSRILAIWDQRRTPQAGEHHPDGFKYGVEYTKEMIDAALRSSDPLNQLPHADIAPFHGTHVAGIVAGTGEPVVRTGGVERRFRGVAAAADLVVVANTRGQTQDPGTVADSADTLDAIAYILKQAKEPWRPVVINLSLGDNIGPHDGTTLLEVGIDNLVKGRGRVLVKSAGNEGDTRHHAEGDLISGTTQGVRIDVPDRESEVIVDVWFSGSAPCAVAVVTPGGEASPQFVAPAERDVPLGSGKVFVDAEVSDPVNGHRRTFVVLRPAAGRHLDPGSWTLRLTGVGHWHAWIQRNSSAGFQQSSNSMTTSVPAASTAVICVASYISDERFIKGGRKGALSKFSGRGPTRDGRRVPTLAAPGQEITSAQPGNRFAARAGTSMAAAVVTGAVARLLALKPSSTGAQIRKCLERTARRDEFTGDAPNDEWGAGKLDIIAAEAEILRSGAQQPKSLSEAVEIKPPTSSPQASGSLAEVPRGRRPALAG
jgi:subtilisin family serine protease